MFPDDLPTPGRREYVAVTGNPIQPAIERAFCLWVRRMHLDIKRIHFDPDYTVGELSEDGVRACYTLEDAVRERIGVPVAAWKIKGLTAIPAGDYVIEITHSRRFGRLMPQIMDVPGFTGVRIHSGNNSFDTDGCILVGNDWGGGDWIGNSRVAYNTLFSKLLAAHKRGEKITISIN